MVNKRKLRPHAADSTGLEPTLFDDRFGQPVVTKKGRIGVSAPLAKTTVLAISYKSLIHNNLIYFTNPAVRQCVGPRDALV